MEAKSAIIIQKYYKKYKIKLNTNNIDELISGINNIKIKQNIEQKIEQKSETTKNKKLSKKQIAVDMLFKPNEQGCSDWITKEKIEIIKELNWGNNGVQRHGIFFNDNRYLWEKSPKKGAILKIRTIGFSYNELYGKLRPINKEFDIFHKSSGCVVCGSMSDLVTDHKNDLYNDPRVLDIKTQTIDDFQCLCNHCNLQKRQITKKTLETGIRYSAINISGLEIFNIEFIEGTKELPTDYKTNINAMKGTYWYDVLAFNKYIKESFEKIINK